MSWVRRARRRTRAVAGPAVAEKHGDKKNSSTKEPQKLACKKLSFMCFRVVFAAPKKTPPSPCRRTVLEASAQSTVRHRVEVALNKGFRSDQLWQRKLKSKCLLKARGSRHPSS